MTIAPFLVGRHYTLVFCILLLFSSSSFCQTVPNPAIAQEIITFNDATTDNRILYLKDNRVAQGQAFQTVYLTNGTEYNAKPLFDFHDACNNSTTFDDLQRWNGNGVNTIAGIKARTKVALVKRGGNCTWTTKVRTVTQLSTTYQLQVDIMILYDNQSYSSMPRYSLLPATGTTTTPVYASPQLPLPANISNMNDNDILPYYQRQQTIVENQPSQIYFVTNDYGLDLLSILQNQCFNTTSSVTNGGPASYVFLIPLLQDFDWSKTMNTGSPNYLSWIIACATFFLIAVLGLLLFFRWWRIRQRREEREYNAMLEERNLIAMQRRKLKPLPVSIVNSYPIQGYHADTIKNTTCAICLDEFEENQPDIRLLPCGHGFCVLCIDPWLTQKSTLCPICKYNCLPVELRETDEVNEETSDGHQAVTSTNNNTNVDHHNNNNNDGPCTESTITMDSTNQPPATTSPPPPLTIVLSALTKKTVPPQPTSPPPPASTLPNPLVSDNEKTTASTHDAPSSSASSATNESSSRPTPDSVPTSTSTHKPDGNH